jgi:hypothetical protein
MKNFKNYNIEAKDKESKKDSEAKDTDKQEQMSEVGEWARAGNTGWIIQFKVNGSDFVASFSPIDEAEQHWKFTYYKRGQRDSSDVLKFGVQSDWMAIWASLIDIIKDFIRIFKPSTIKFIGMSISKRGIYYRDLFKLYVKDYRYAFRRLGYFSTFDTRDLQQAPSFVVKKGELKEPEAKKEPEKEVKKEVKPKEE